MDIKKIVAGIVGVGGLAIVGLLAAITMQPNHIHLERQVVINATSADMLPFARDLAKVNAWSPWDGKDPTLKRTFSDPTDGVGAWYAWDGNDEVGAGKQTITLEEPNKVVHALEFYRPFEGNADATISWTEANNQVTVVWAFDQEADFPTKAMTLFMSFDDMLGPDYELGMKQLKPLVEEAAAKANAERLEARALADAAKADTEDAVAEP